MLYYYPRMIRPLEPAVLVYAFYGNGAAFGYSSEETWELAQRVIAYAKTDFPGIRIYLCSAQFQKAEPNGAKLRDIRRFNSWLRTFAEENENVFYIDVTKCDVLRERKDIYVEDGVHYNREGYELYADFFREELKGELEKY
jgi:lysophospholipase L1-like esterase